MKPQNRTFVLSGGSSGLGLATAHALLDASAYVAVLDIHDNDTPAVKGSGHLKFIKTDITNELDVSTAVDDIVAWVMQTGATLGGVINCAGVAPAAKIIDSSGHPHSLDLWKLAIDLNLTGAFNLTRLVSQHLINVEPSGEDGERGVIVFVASSAAFEGQPGQAAYAASKGALVSATLPISRDLARYGIRVNTVAPAAFDSAMTARMPAKTRSSLIRELNFPKRFGTAYEFSQAVIFIIECGYMNGETLRLSGGARLPGRL